MLISTTRLKFWIVTGLVTLLFRSFTSLAFAQLPPQAPPIETIINPENLGAASPLISEKPPTLQTQTEPTASQTPIETSSTTENTMSTLVQTANQTLEKQATPAVVTSESRQHSTGYLARQENLRAFFEAVSSHINRPIIVSKLAARKQVSGEFDLATAGTVIDRVARQLNLIWYSDRYAIYIYDVSEMKNSVVTLQNTTVEALNIFLKKSGLLDSRYPLRSDGISTFYLSGPPIFVDLVSRTAEFLDKQRVNMGSQEIGIIRLHNTFVTDRSYKRRDEDVTIPGIASVIQTILAGETQLTLGVKKAGVDVVPSIADLVSDEAQAAKQTPQNPNQQSKGAGNIKIAPYPETNSLLVKGTNEQIRFIQNLVAALDEEKRHVELALWIIDLQKDDLDQLGANWQGSVNIGSQFSAGFNTGTSPDSYSAVDGTRFMASIMALARNKRASIVSRPVLLTQENTQAMFDNSRTFYTKLIGERAVELNDVTYGTMINVLPRFTQKDEIELSLVIEDGNAINNGSELPTVGRSKISTVARVPKGKSLLIGGYTRGENGEEIGKIPGLGNLPWIGGAFRYRKKLSANTVRVFLIQPKEIKDSMDLEAGNLTDDIEFKLLIKELDQTSQISKPSQFSRGDFGGH